MKETRDWFDFGPSLRALLILSGSAGFRAALAALVDSLAVARKAVKGGANCFWFAEFIGAQRRPLTADAAKASYRCLLGAVKVLDGSLDSSDSCGIQHRPVRQSRRLVLGRKLKLKTIAAWRKSNYQFEFINNLFDGNSDEASISEQDGEGRFVVVEFLEIVIRSELERQVV